MISKYRAWIKDKEAMEDVLGLEWDTYGELTKVKTKEGTYNANQVKVMSYIGELDGQEIYEDDIIWDSWGEDYATIEWNEEDFCYDFNWMNRSYIESMYNRNSDLIVVGNAYQTPIRVEEDE